MLNLNSVYKINDIVVKLIPAYGYVLNISNTTNWKLHLN